MKRLLMLASSGLFAAAVAILPVSVNAATTPDGKAPVTTSTTAPATTPDGKAAAATAKDAPKPGTTTSTPTGAGAPAKVGG